MAKTKPKLSVGEQALTAIKANGSHILFAFFATYLIILGIGMVSDAIRAAELGVPYNDSMVWPYGLLVFGGMLLGGVLAQVAMIRRKDRNG
jgi:TRAP-type C4-dicarboxylate transport system permease small subunit